VTFGKDTDVKLVQFEKTKIAMLVAFGKDTDVNKGHSFIPLIIVTSGKDTEVNELQA
jgi:hypothetical protein